MAQRQLCTQNINPTHSVDSPYLIISLQFRWIACVRRFPLTRHQMHEGICHLCFWYHCLGCPFFYAKYDDVIKWKHFPRYWSFVRGIHRSPKNSPHKSQWRGALMFSLICVWINGWVNNHEAGDLRRYYAHYDAGVMNMYGMNIRLVYKLIFPCTKLPPFRRRHFQMHFREWKILYFDSNVTEICS